MMTAERWIIFDVVQTSRVCKHTVNCSTSCVYLHLKWWVYKLTGTLLAVEWRDKWKIASSLPQWYTLLRIAARSHMPPWRDNEIDVRPLHRVATIARDASKARAGHTI